MNKIRFTTKQTRILSITLGIWGAFLVISGIIINTQNKPIIQTNYTLKVDRKKLK